MSWATFLKSHWDVIAAIDFTTVEVWTKGGLTTFYLLFAMELSTRRVHFVGCTTIMVPLWNAQALHFWNAIHTVGVRNILFLTGLELIPGVSQKVVDILNRDVGPTGHSLPRAIRQA